MARRDWCSWPSKKFLVVSVSLISWSIVFMYYMSQAFHESHQRKNRMNEALSLHMLAGPATKRPDQSSDSVPFTKAQMDRPQKTNPPAECLLGTCTSHDEPTARSRPAKNDAVEGYLRMLHNSGLSNTYPNSGNVQVFIVSQKRSGTSFVGELFNQSLDFTYFFEPLSSLTQRMLKRLTFGSFDAHASQILDGILRGNFTHMPEGWWSGEIPRHTCWCVNLAPVPGLCLPQDPANSFSFREQMELLGASTRFRKGIAIKAIRIQNIHLLKRFVLDPSMNIKIIHLVRDPRGVMNSRYRIPESNADLLRRRGPRADEIADLCEHTERNLRYFNETWLRGRYKLIRYEDIAENPLEVASEIYNFVGIEFPKRVKTWLDANTRSTTDNYAFSHSRNSKDAAYAWRRQLDYYRMVSIQARCRNTMQMLGYLPILSYFDLVNFEVATVGKLPELWTAIDSNTSNSKLPVGLPATVKDSNSKRELLMQAAIETV